MLLTSKISKGTVRALQRKLYRKAKHQPTFRFYSLYDKVYRSDVLQVAYDLVRKNKGGPGLVQQTFALIVSRIGRVAYLRLPGMVCMLREEGHRKAVCGNTACPV